MTYAHREGERERDSFVSSASKIFVVDQNLLRHTKNFQQFSFFVSLTPHIDDDVFVGC